MAGGLFKPAASALTSASATVAVTSTTVIAANSQRSGLIIINESSETVWFSFHGVALANKGFSLKTDEKVILENQTTYRNKLTGIVGTSTSVVTVEEI